MTTTCGTCGKTWDTDPRLQVPCPYCGADAGSPCQRPSGWDCEAHADRDEAAMDAEHVENCWCVNEQDTGPTVETDGEQAGLGAFGGAE